MDETNSEWCVVRDRLQKLADLLYWQWRMRLAAWSSGDSNCIRMAEECGARTTVFIRHLRDIMCWVPYTIEDRSTVLCLSLGIRCVPFLKQGTESTSTPKLVAVPEEPEAKWDTAPAVPSQSRPARSKGLPGNNIGFYGPTHLAVPRSCNNIGFYVPTNRPHAPIVTRQVGGRGMWRHPGPSPTAVPTSAMDRRNCLSDRSPWKGHTVPTTVTSEPCQSVARGGRLID